MSIGHGLRFDALSGIDQQHSTLTRSQTTGNFVRKIHVAGGIDQVESIVTPVLSFIDHRHGVAFNRDPSLALQVHRVEKLGFHITHFYGARHLEDTVRQSCLSVIDMGNDAEIASMVEISHEWQKRAKITAYRKSSTLFLENKLYLCE